MTDKSSEEETKAEAERLMMFRCIISSITESEAVYVDCLNTLLQVSLSFFTPLDQDEKMLLLRKKREEKLDAPDTKKTRKDTDSLCIMFLLSCHETVHEGYQVNDWNNTPSGQSGRSECDLLQDPGLAFHPHSVRGGTEETAVTG